MARERVFQVPAAGASSKVGLARHRVEAEEVPVLAVPARRTRPPVAGLAETVATLPRRALTLHKPAIARGDPPRNPMREGADRGIRVIDYQSQRDRILWHPRPLKRRRAVPAPARVTRRDPLAICKRTAAQLHSAVLPRRPTRLEPPCRHAGKHGPGPGDCPVSRGTLVTAVPSSWLHSESGRELLHGGVAAACEVVFDRDGEVREPAVALDFAKARLGFEHAGGGPA